MSHRLITDRSGTTWQIWSVSADGLSGRPVATVAPAFAQGWLAFEQTGVPADRTPERRRLAPVPAGWVTAPDDEVLALLAAAAPVVRRLRDVVS